jgi:hypothetical protein
MMFNLQLSVLAIPLAIPATKEFSPVTSTTPSSTTWETIQLAPRYNIPLALMALAIPLLWVQIWVSGAIALFSLFLLLQAVTLRLWFTDTALDIYRGDTLIRRFPYAEWQTWTIFWPPVPILFYFKEVNSIHFVPVLFDAKALTACLSERCPIDPSPSDRP